MHFEQHTELDNLIAMQNLRTSANKGSNDAWRVRTSLTTQKRLSEVDVEMDRASWEWRNSDIALFVTSQLETCKLSMQQKENQSLFLESATVTNSGTTGHGQFLERCKSDLETAHSSGPSQSTHEHSESQRNDQPRLLLSS